MIRYLAWKWGQQFCIWKWMGLVPGVAWTSASLMLNWRIVVSIHENLYPTNWHLFFVQLFSWKGMIYQSCPFQSAIPKIIFLHSGESRRLATHKRWRFSRGHDKPIYRSYAIYYFPGGMTSNLLICSWKKTVFLRGFLRALLLFQSISNNWV